MMGNADSAVRGVTDNTNLVKITFDYVYLVNK